MSNLPPSPPPPPMMPYATPMAPRPTSGVAIASLVTGIFGMCVPLFGIVAIVLGAMGMSRTKRGDVGGRGMAIAGLVLGICGTLFVMLQLAILLPSLNRARETANRVKCASNLRQVATAIALYANENRGAYPPDFVTLLNTEDIAPQTFTCPASHSTPATAIWTNDAAARAAGTLDYVYVGEGLTSSVNADEPVAIEIPADHGDGGNVVYGDGHVEYLMKAALLKAVKPLVGTPRLTAEEAAAINKP